MASQSHDFFHDANTNEKQKNGMSFFFFSEKRLHFFKKHLWYTSHQPMKRVENLAKLQGERFTPRWSWCGASCFHDHEYAFFMQTPMGAKGGVRNVSKNENGKMKKRSFQILKSTDPWPACGRPRLGLCSHVSLPDFGGCWSTCKHKNMKNRKFENWKFESEISSRPALGRPPAGLGPVL